MVQKLFWLLILRACAAPTEELLLAKAKAKTATSESAEAVELTSPIGRPTLPSAIRAGGAADAAEAGDGRR